MRSRENDLNSPSWLRLCAWGALCAVTPSAVWRVLMICGLLPGTAELRAFELSGDPALGYAYVFGLSVVQVATGALTLGLIRPWGERLAGVRIPRAFPLVLGCLGGATVTYLFNIRMTQQICFGHRPDAGLLHGWPLVTLAWCYLPILLWGPLVIASSVGYWRRRGRSVPAPT